MLLAGGRNHVANPGDICRIGRQAVINLPPEGGVRHLPQPGHSSLKGAGKAGMADTTSIYPTWARRIIRQRETLDITQQQLADRAGTTRATVIRWEKGKNQPPKPARGRLANALEMPLDELNGWFA